MTDTVKLLWFFLWRMSLWGLLLGAAVMVAVALMMTIGIAQRSGLRSDNSG